MVTTGLLIQAGTSRIPEIATGEMAVHLPDGRLLHWDHMTPEQRDQLQELQSERAPDLMCYIWKVDAEGSDNIYSPTDPAPSQPTSTLGAWLDEGGATTKDD